MISHDQIGEWSEKKLDVLRLYLQAYTRVLDGASHNGRALKYSYVDAFSSTGTHLRKSTQEPIDGSITIASQMVPYFKEIHAVELNNDKAQFLKGRFSHDNRVTIWHGDCNELLARSILPRFRYEDFQRAFCFIDPYNINVDFEIFKLAGQMRSIEVLFCFMVHEPSRNLDHPNDKTVRTTEERMTRLWGDETWRTVKNIAVQEDLFGYTSNTIRNSREGLVKAFVKRLNTEGNFTYTAHSVPLRIDQGAHLYSLIFAGNNEKGLKIMKSVFNKLARQERGTR